MNENLERADVYNYLGFLFDFQTILPLLDYTGFLLISGNVSDRSDLQTLQNDALRVCFNVRMRDRILIV